MLQGLYESLKAQFYFLFWLVKTHLLIGTLQGCGEDTILQHDKRISGLKRMN